MASNHDLDRHDELLIAVALFEHSREWDLCRVIYERHGLTPSDAVLELG